MSGPGPAKPRAGRRLDPDELAALEDQRDFLLRSLQDLEREHEAGDLDDADHAALRDDYTARAAETIRAIDEQCQAFAEARRRTSPGRLLATLSVVVVLAVGAGFLVANNLGAREAGGTLTGGLDVQRSPSQRAQLCIQEINAGPSDAIGCFRDVLADDPENVVALTWLSWTIELSATGLDPAQVQLLRDSARTLVDQAVEADPDYSYARAFRAVLACRRGDYADAQQYLADFRDRDPSPDAEGVITQMDLESSIQAGLDGTGGCAFPGDPAGGTPTTIPADTPTTTTTPG